GGRERRAAAGRAGDSDRGRVRICRRDSRGFPGLFRLARHARRFARPDRGRRARGRARDAERSAHPARPGGEGRQYGGFPGDARRPASTRRGGGQSGRRDAEAAVTADKLMRDENASLSPVRSRVSGNPGLQPRRKRLWVPAFAGTNGFILRRITSLTFAAVTLMAALAPYT